jgi:Protein of unknown function DUF115
VITAHYETVNGEIPPFMRLGGITTVAGTPKEESLENIRLSLKRPHPKIQQLPEFQKFKHNIPVALAAGGPSLSSTLDELRKHDCIVACGSAHDHIVGLGFKPRYTVIADPDPEITALYLKRPCPSTTYLVATQCHESVFKALEGFPVATWHCHGDGYKEMLDELDPGWNAIGGGCTATLRALSMMIMFGYGNIHFFGFDSCLGEEDKTHAYPMATDREEIGAIYDIKIGYGVPGNRTYRCAGYQLAQAVHFKEFWELYNHVFVPTVHGDGLMAQLVNDVQARATKLDKPEAA